MKSLMIRLFVIWAVALIAVAARADIGMAANEGPLFKFEPRYHALKRQTLTMLHRSADPVSKAADSLLPLLELRKEVMDFCFEVKKQFYAEQVQNRLKRSSGDSIPQLFSLAYSCDAMEQILETQCHLQRGSAPSESLHRIRAKYEEVWSLVDPETGVKPTGAAMEK